MLVLMCAFLLVACDDQANGEVSGMLPGGFSLDKSPMEILSSKMPGSWDTDTSAEGKLINAMGVKTLAFIINLFGIMSAIVIIVASFVALLVVNYPKTVAQTKQRIVHVLFTVVIMASLPLILDCILSLLIATMH